MKTVSNKQLGEGAVAERSKALRLREKINESQKIPGCPPPSLGNLSFFNMGLSWPLFGFIFPFSWYIVSLQLIIFTIVNDDRKQERRRKSMHLSITCY